VGRKLYSKKEQVVEERKVYEYRTPMEGGKGRGWRTVKRVVDTYNNDKGTNKKSKGDCEDRCLREGKKGGTVTIPTEMITERAIDSKVRRLESRGGETSSNKNLAEHNAEKIEEVQIQSKEKG